MAVVNSSGVVTIARIHGVPVRVSGSSLILGAVIAMFLVPMVQRAFPSLNWVGVATVIGAYVVSLFGSVLLHELAHLFVGRATGKTPISVELTFYGGVTEFASRSKTAAGDFLSSGAGPAMNIAIAGISYAASQFAPLPPLGMALTSTLTQINVLLAGFNLIPALPLDGGHMLRSMVWGLGGGRGLGTRVAGRLGQVFAVGVAIWAFWRYNDNGSVFGLIFALMIAWFLFSGATGALRAHEAEERYASITVAKVGRPAITVHADATVESIMALLDDNRGVVVVTSGTTPIGIVDPKVVFAVDPVRAPNVLVSSVMTTVPTGAIVPDSAEGVDLLTQLDGGSIWVAVDGVGKPTYVLAAEHVTKAMQQTHSRSTE